MKEKKVKSLKIVFKDGNDYDACCDAGLDKSEVVNYIERVFMLEQTKLCIKDEKIRKLVKEWSEINNIKSVFVCESFNSWGFKNKNNSEPRDKEYMRADILFRGEKPEELEFNKEYTITELIRDCEDVKEPLIKNKKIRKAVREWAVANNIEEIIIFDCYNGSPYVRAGNVEFAENAGHLKIQFRTKEQFDTDKIYTVNELCGDDE